MKNLALLLVSVAVAAGLFLAAGRLVPEPPPLPRFTSRAPVPLSVKPTPKPGPLSAPDWKTAVPDSAAFNVVALVGQGTGLADEAVAAGRLAGVVGEADGGHGLVRVTDEQADVHRGAGLGVEGEELAPDAADDLEIEPLVTGEFEEIVRRLRKEVDPRFNLVTDVIAGHPGEGDREFEETLELLRRTEPDMVNISKFFPRPGTPASKMRAPHSKTIKERSRLLTELCEAIALKRSRLWVGWEGRVLVDERGRGKELVGRNYAYKPVVIKDPGVVMGEEVTVRIVEAHPYWLGGLVPAPRLPPSP